MRTLFVKPDQMKHEWYVVDAKGQILGRLASRVASILRGKHRPSFTPSVDCGDHVIIVNAERIRLTGAKARKKIYHRHSGFPGGLKSITAEKLLHTRPSRVLSTAIKGMLPKNSLGRRLARKLYIYTGPDHPHAAQQPKPLFHEPNT